MKAVLIVGIWLIPILGVTMALWEIPSNYDPRVAGERPRAGQTPRAAVAPGAINHVGYGQFSLLENMTIGDGVPTSTGKLSTNGLAEVQHAIELGRRAWLLHFRDAMATTAHLHETVDAWVLSSFTPRAARSAATYVADTRKRIARLLDGLAEFPAMHAASSWCSTTWTTTTNTSPTTIPTAASSRFSGGMYINYGCPHFVTVQAPLSTIEPVIAHEMTHSALAHLRAPVVARRGDRSHHRTPDLREQPAPRETRSRESAVTSNSGTPNASRSSGRASPSSHRRWQRTLLRPRAQHRGTPRQGVAVIRGVRSRTPAVMTAEQRQPREF